jgi:hypothetical protein
MAALTYVLADMPERLNENEVLRRFSTDFEVARRLLCLGKKRQPC